MVVGDNQMIRPVPGIRGEHGFGISMLSRKCLPLSSSLNKFKLFFFFPEGEVVIQKMLIPCQMEKSYFCVSFQVAK